jgi:hypothetical protein
MNKSNGQQKPKTDVAFGQSKRLKLLRNEPITGSNSYGPYYLYPVVTEDGIEESFFAPEPLHNIIKEHNLKAGSEFILSRVQNGKPGSSKLELSLVSVPTPPPASSTEQQADNLKEIMRQCLVEAVEIVHSLPDIPFQNDDIRAICASLFIARTR